MSDAVAPQAVLFCCDHNAVRSPMAEGLMKQRHGQRVYVQSAGVAGGTEVDGFAIAVCDEIGVELSLHRSRSFQQLEDFGETLAGFDLVVALSPASHAVAGDLAARAGVAVEFWPVPDPTAEGRTRDDKLEAYRRVRDAISGRLADRFG